MNFFSREHALSYVKTELVAIYASLKDCIDMDIDYINRLAKPKKANASKHIQ